MYYGNVEAFICKNSGTTADARDVFQEAMIAAWLNVKEERFRPKSEESLGGYIFQIAKYKWLDVLKSKGYKSSVRLVRDDLVEDDRDDFQQEETDKRLQMLRSIYAKLDEKCKAILDRFYFQKLSLDAIGAELEHDASTVKTLKYRCMQKLRSAHLSNKQNG